LGGVERGQRERDDGESVNNISISNWNFHFESLPLNNEYILIKIL
jgi:hypothetical protein